MRFEEGDVISFKVSINASVIGMDGASAIYHIVKRAQPGSGYSTTFEKPISRAPSDDRYNLRTANFLMSIRLTDSTDTRRSTSDEEVVSHKTVVLRHADTFDQMTVMISFKGKEVEEILKVVDTLKASKSAADKSLADALNYNTEQESIYNEFVVEEEASRSAYMKTVNEGASVAVQTDARLVWTNAKDTTASSLETFNTTKEETTAAAVNLNVVKTDLASAEKSMAYLIASTSELKEERLEFINNGYRRALAKYEGLDGTNVYVNSTEGESMDQGSDVTREQRSARNTAIIVAAKEAFHSRSNDILNVADKISLEDSDMTELIEESRKPANNIVFGAIVTAWGNVGQSQD
tara:strand:- start:11444 stop:12496 length:1053 start_codon:yes stop_codon:yes gene_type:complete